MPRAVSRRWPLEPLLQLLEGWGIEDHRPQAKKLGIADRNFYRWRNEGGIPEFTADRLCTRLGFHPVQLWPDWFSPDVEDECA